MADAYTRAKQKLRTTTPMWTLKRRTTPRRWLTSLLAATALSQPAFGQNAPNFETLRRTQLNGAERRSVEQWIDAQVQRLFTEEDAKGEGVKFAQQFTGEARHAQSTSAYKSALAQIVAESFTKAYKNAGSGQAQPKAIGVVCVLISLRAFESPAALPCFRAALKDPIAGTRTVAARGLLDIRAKIDDAQWTPLATEIQQAAEAEVHPVTRDLLYRLLRIDEGPRAGRAPAMVRSIVDKQLEQMEKRNEVPCLADAEAAVWLARKVLAGNDAQAKKDEAKRLARLMAGAAHAYVNLGCSESQKHELEQVVQITEEQLKAIASALARDQTQPDATKALLDGGDEREAKLSAEVLKWIGTEGAPGLLNGQAFGFPIGLGIVRPQATSSAPAGSRPASAPG